MPAPVTSVARVGRTITPRKPVILTVSAKPPWTVTVNGHLIETYERQILASSMANRLADALGQVADIAWVDL